MSNGSGPLSDVGGGKLVSSSACVAPVGLCFVHRGGRSWKMSCQCRHPVLQTHSCMHRKKRCTLSVPSEEIPGSQEPNLI